jgi:hypothetical protein
MSSEDETSAEQAVSKPYLIDHQEAEAQAEQSGAAAYGEIGMAKAFRRS